MARQKKIKTPKHKMASKRSFLRRMLRVEDSYLASKLDMITIHEIFSWYPEEIDFMEKVGPPPFKINNILWFKTEEGKRYLQKKLLEFHYKVPEYEKPVDTGEVFGENVYEHKPTTIRDFLLQ